MPAYMIVVKDNPVSEYYASITIPRWKSFGYDVKVFDAITPETQASFELVFDKVYTKKYTKAFGTTKAFTPTEKAVWYSHVSLWKLCAETNQNIIVLEHDSYLMYPDRVQDHSMYDFVTYDAGAMGCYMISPELAKFACRVLIDNKTPISCGPYGFLYDILVHNIRYNFKGILKKTENHVVASNQIYNPEFKTTISHYEGSDVEDKKKDLFQYSHEYILAETGKPIDITKTIKVLGD